MDVQVLLASPESTRLCNSLDAATERWGQPAALMLNSRLAQVGAAKDPDQLAQIPGVKVSLTDDFLQIDFPRDRLTIGGRRRVSEPRSGHTWDFVVDLLTINDDRLEEATR